MSKSVLVIGSGGREHAICWKLSFSEHVKIIYNLPGSCAIDELPKTEIVPLHANETDELVKFCQEHEIDLVIIGPENYLADGIADELYKVNINCFGPRKNEAQLETDKSRVKAFMDKYRIPQPRWKSFVDATSAKHFIRNPDFPALVVKTNGFTDGKGVIIAKDMNEACRAVDQILLEQKFGEAGATIVVEEYLEGEEISVLAFTDGKTATAMLPVQNHKRLRDGDQGPNTSGMGVYCPCPPTIKNQGLYIQENVLNRILSGLLQENLIYCGVICVTLMISRNGIRVLGFNCRMGDPETQAILPLLQSDLFTITMSCCQGTLAQQTISWKTNLYSVGVVMVSHGFPEVAANREVITGVENVSKLPNHLVFHNGTALENKNLLVTNGSRVLTAVALATELSKAACNATQACSLIHFSGIQYRRDIAFKAILRQMIRTGQVTYKVSAVSSDAGDSVMQNIKPLATLTNRVGSMSQLGEMANSFDLPALNYKDPILIATTRGVGEKFEVANALGIYKNIGIDLVAMCVNDLLVRGAEPLFFLDYYAIGKLNMPIMKEVFTGITTGCQIAGCTLIGGHTMEMPKLYSKDNCNLVGFAVGVVERKNLIPKRDQIYVGDVVIGLSSSGIHCNGFDVVQSTCKLANIDYLDTAPFSSTGKSYGEEFLTPTHIYSTSVLPLLQKGYIKSFSHITGGGLLENVLQMLCSDLRIEIDLKSSHVLPVFGWLAALGEINQNKMLRTFNCGVGAALIVSSRDVDKVLQSIVGVKAFVIGKVMKRSAVDHHQVVVKNFDETILMQMHAFIPQIISKFHVSKKKVAVLISGSGTNLQALIDATNDPTQHIGAEIVLVISNRSNVEGLQRAANANIPTKVVKHTDFDSRESFDQALHALLVQAEVDIICLAGFMHILSAQFVNKWRGKIINIHPSLLPSFKGVNAQKQALDAGVKVTGCTVHFVEPDVEFGPIIMQETVPVFPNDTESKLIERIKTQAEHKVYPQALKLLATDKIYLNSSRKIGYNY